jgi:hypothetical protein
VQRVEKVVQKVQTFLLTARIIWGADRNTAKVRKKPAQGGPKGCFRGGIEGSYRTGFKEGQI